MYFWFYSNQISSFWPNNLTNNRLLQCEMPLDLSRATCQTFCWWWSCLYVKASVWKPLIFGSPKKVFLVRHTVQKKFKLLPPPKKSFLVEGKIYFLQFGGFGVMMSNPDALNIMWHPSTCIQKKEEGKTVILWQKDFCISTQKLILSMFALFVKGIHYSSHRQPSTKLSKCLGKYGWLEISCSLSKYSLKRGSTTI